MLIFLPLTAILAAGIWVMSRSKDPTASFGFLATVISSGALFVCAFTLALNRSEDASLVEKYKAFNSTLSRARATGKLGEIERAAVMKEILAWNERLASCRYWNSTPFDIWHSDALAELPDIE